MSTGSRSAEVQPKFPSPQKGFVSSQDSTHTHMSSLLVSIPDCGAFVMRLWGPVTNQMKLLYRALYLKFNGGLKGGTVH